MQRFLTTAEHYQRCQLDEARRPLEILGGQRVADSIGRRAMLLVPLARAPMQGRYPIGLLLHQARSENLGKEVMVAKPATLIIKRNNKQVATLEDLQNPSAIFPSDDGVAQRPT